MFRNNRRAWLAAGLAVVLTVAMPSWAGGGLSSASALSSQSAAISSAVARAAEVALPWGMDGVGISVRNLGTGETYSSNADAAMVSASMVKWIWLAAAMRNGADVSDLTGPIFEESDNSAAGEAIDRAGGVAAVNTFYWDVVGMSHSSQVASWSVDIERVDPSISGTNEITAADASLFLDKLYHNQLLSPDLTHWLIGEAQRSPDRMAGSDCDLCAEFNDRLPDAVAAAAASKGGWLDDIGYNHVMGIISVPGHDPLAVVVVGHTSGDFAQATKYEPFVVCEIYRAAFSDDSADCGRAGDPSSLDGSEILGADVAVAANPTGAGFWTVDAAGVVEPYDGAPTFGDTTGVALNDPIVGIAATTTGRGYWLVASDGGIFSFGDAAFYGSTGATVLNRPIVGMAGTATNRGYWLVASDGGIFSFGDATFLGSMGATKLNRSVVGMAATPDAHGYWMVASDGGIFSFGDAAFFGSTGAIELNKPIISMSPSTSGRGYLLVASDGGIFTFGDAEFRGSTAVGAQAASSAPAIGLVTRATGYWIVNADDVVTKFG